MKTLKYRSSGQEVYLLEEMLQKLGYKVDVSTYFDLDTDAAVKAFQQKNNLVVDGIVGLKTWSKLIEKLSRITASNDKFLSEKDLVGFSVANNLELPAVKAVNEVESSGKGFLLDGKPRILFEGHVFWRELQKRGINAATLFNANSADVLYEKWTKKYYRGGAGEYDRLAKAASLPGSPLVREAAYCSASWGAFQIMGFHYKNLGYASIDQFVGEMSQHEREHLAAFGKFIGNTTFGGKKLMDWLREKNWEKFANGYNGAGYKQNKYDLKLEAAYKKYSA